MEGIDFSPEWVKICPVLIIPTGGLSGIDSSPSFKSALAQYVAEGGTVVCFMQVHGYEFQGLPGGQVRGVGYVEDLSCWGDAFGVVERHPIFTGIDLQGWYGNGSLDAFADGYFIKTLIFLPQEDIITCQE